jgi:hypothetical protein
MKMEFHVDATTLEGIPTASSLFRMGAKAQTRVIRGEEEGESGEEGRINQSYALQQ